MDTLFHVLVQNSSDAIVMLDATGGILFASESSARLLGYTLDERMGRSAFEMMHPDDVGATRATFHECLRRPGVPIPAEYRVRHKDGAWRHIESIAVNPLDEPAVSAIARDISRQKDAEDRLRKSEARYRSLIQGAAYGIYRTTVEGKILDANPAIAAMLGYTMDELLSLNMAAVYKSAAERHGLIDQY